MSRRGRSVASISLFAFQDIITSVCGLVIVIVLLLAIELTSTRANPGNTPPPPTPGTPDSATEAARLQREIDELQRQVVSNDRLVEQAGQLSALELQQRIAELKHQQSLLESRLVTAAQHEQALIAAGEDAQERNQGLSALKTDVLQAELERARLQADLQQEEESSRVRFAFPRGTERRGMLAVISDQRILVGPMDQPTVQQQFSGNALLPGYPNAVRDFLAWVRGRDTDSYTLVLIRPSGVGRWNELQAELVRSRKSFGFELIEEAEQVFDLPGTGER